MSEPTSPSPAAIAWESRTQPAVWAIPPPRQRWGLHLLLLAATFLSTLIVGARIYANFALRQPAFVFDDNISFFPYEWMWQAPARMMQGLSFSLTLMFILLAHEMGHYLCARHYRVHVTLPFFIPFPSLIGTFGAFIRIKSPIPTRAALFDIGIAGPIAGFIPSCVAVLVGLSLSHPLMFVGPLDNEPGFPAVFHLAARLLRLDVPVTSLSLHPIAVAGWVGMFATALNLLPGGQLDGGHILFSVFPKLHRWVSLAVVVALVPLAKYCWVGWLIWAVVLWLTSQHPPTPGRREIGRGRKWLAVCAVGMLALAFTPTPITGASGRQKWPDIREAGMQVAHYVHSEARHLLHRK